VPTRIRVYRLLYRIVYEEVACKKVNNEQDVLKKKISAVSETVGNANVFWSQGVQPCLEVVQLAWQYDQIRVRSLSVSKVEAHSNPFEFGEKTEGKSEV
jgi:hypothetical protein